MANGIIDYTPHGMGKALCKAGKVILWHLGSAAVFAVIFEAGRLLNLVQHDYPVYGLYAQVGIGLLNSAGVYMKEWLNAVRPGILVPGDSAPSNSAGEAGLQIVG